MSKVFYVVSDATTGRVKRVGFTDDAMVAAQAQDGESSLQIDQVTALNVRGGVDSYIVQNGAVVNVGPVLANAQAAKLSELSIACAAAITSGFTYSGRQYPADEVTQRNMVLMAATGGPLWCLDSGTWSFLDHTAADAQGAISAFVTSRTAAQQKLIALTGQVNAAADAATVLAIKWT